MRTISPSDSSTHIRDPHGIAIHNGIDRVIVTRTVKPDISDMGEWVTVLEASTDKVLSTHKVSTNPLPSKAALVEVMFAANEGKRGTRGGKAGKGD